MTCIIGLVHKDHVYMGGDSAASNGWDTTIIKRPKVFKIGEMLIGYTTSFRMGQLLQYELAIKPQKKSMDDYTYMVTIMAEAVRGLFNDKGFLWVDSQRQSGGQFLVGYRKNLYEFQSDFSVLQYETLFAAVGCGASYAMGAMNVTQGMTPKKRIKAALKTSAEFSTGVNGPFYVKKL